MMEYSELMQLSDQIKKKIVYYSFENVHPDEIMKKTFEMFDKA